MFDAFWRATGEPAFDALTASCAECYRLSIETSRAPKHRVYRMQREAGEVPRFMAHFFVFGASGEEAGVRTHEITLEEPLWTAFDAILTAVRFWDAPTENSCYGLDGSTYTLEGWKTGVRHKVVRWSPNPIFSGGELIAVATDYVERLGELAVLECDAEMRGRYFPEYEPLRQNYPRGNLT